MTGIGRRDRRTLVAGALVIGTLVAVSRGLPAWRTLLRERRAAAAEVAQQLRNARATIAGFQLSEDSLTVLRARFEALAPLLIAASSPATGAANLASHVSGIAAAAGVQIGSFQLSEDTLRHGEFVRVGVRLSLTGDVGGLATLVTTLERGTPLLVIRSLAIDQPDPAAADRAESLRASLTVEALVQSRTAGAH